ncbi:MAG: GntR family transcriptional regulator [Spirochaetales bacterium]|nr:GntR family transcriptional regulator [Spirochaetales bacterium]
MERVQIRKVTAADAVYEQLKGDLVSLYFKPGEKLSEAKLAERYGVSRDPVRKSVSRLVQEDMLESKPQVGTIVKGISIEEGKAICEIRLLLESFATRSAAVNIADDVIDGLLSEYDMIARRLSIQDDEKIKNEIYSLDDRMHQAIYEACGNCMIKTVIASFSHIIKRIQISNMTYHQRKVSTMEEMHEIMLALKEHDVERADRAMKVHIGNIKKTLEMK